MKRMILIAVLMLSVALVGCSDDDNNPMAPQLTAQLRVGHLSPDAPAVDVWVNGARVLTNVPFTAFSNYLDVPAGDANIQVTPAGATEPVVIDATIELMANTAYTVAATGLLSQNDLAPIVLVDNLSTRNGSAQVRFVHTSADAPAVNVTVASGPTLFDNVEFRQASSYLNVDQGIYDLSVQLSSNGTQVLAVNGQALSGNTNYTIFAIGLAGDGSLAALPVVDAGTASGKLVGSGSSGKVPIYALTQKAGLNTLARAIEATKLQKTLNTDGPFTVFAPTDEAFAKLPAELLENLLADPDALTEILLYHVVPGTVTAAQVVTLTEAPTLLDGKKVNITVNGDVFINDSKVVATDIMAKNGVVHLIDNVLIPPM